MCGCALSNVPTALVGVGVLVPALEAAAAAAALRILNASAVEMTLLVLGVARWPLRGVERAGLAIPSLVVPPPPPGRGVERPLLVRLAVALS